MRDEERRLDAGVFYSWRKLGAWSAMTLDSGLRRNDGLKANTLKTVVPAQAGTQFFKRIDSANKNAGPKPAFSVEANAA